MNNETNPIDELKQQVREYTEARVQLLKIQLAEKVARIVAVFFSSTMIALLAFFLLFFLSIAGGFYFGNLLHSYPSGFLIICGFYFLLLVAVIIFRKPLLEKNIADKVAEQLFENDHDE